ncbi:ABC transporter ATP-binding protein/permease [Paenibacillus senegalensis]|uniref:ABC transporter ATP-binding protein/permease n=1 Tax=Paenibacillus senegalensis TaxID=1465766 RepID=UPI0005A9E6F4|nr:ABC transporter ATP-binding protein/permease [Paenibacillus senegalensis]
MAVQRKRLMLLGVVSFALGAAIVGQAALFAAIVERIFVQSASFSAIVTLLGALMAVMLARTLFSYWNGRIGLKMAADAKTAMRKAAISHLIQNSVPASLSGQTGGKVSLVLDAVDEVDSYFSQYMPRMLEMAVIPAMILIVVFSQHVNSGLIMLVTAPFIPVFMILVGLKTKKKSEEKFAQLAEFSGTFLDSLQGLVTLKLFAKTSRQQQEIERSSLGFRDATMGILRIAFTNTFMLELIVMLSIGLVALELAFQLFVFHSLSFATAFLILLLVPEFYTVLKNVGTAFHSGRTSMGAARKVEDMLENPLEGPHSTDHTDAAAGQTDKSTDPGKHKLNTMAGDGGAKMRDRAVEVNDRTEAGEVPGRTEAVEVKRGLEKADEAEEAGRSVKVPGSTATGEVPGRTEAGEVPDKTEVVGGGHLKLSTMPPLIELKDVRFQYAPGAFSLNAGTLTIPPGKQAAIVGKSGSGKTTLLHLIAGLLEPSSGEVLVNGRELKHQEERSWFEHVSYITQHPYIFAGTLAANIAIGAGRDVSRTEIEEAAEAAGLGAVIAGLELGYDTMVGEGGRGLSGGEKQRLALARAFLNQPSVLLFDEPTVGLDLHTERVLQRSIAQLARKATMITVAHRLHTIRHADVILFLENGVLLESGSHEELLRRLPQYAEMVDVQRRGGVR